MNPGLEGGRGTPRPASKEARTWSRIAACSTVLLDLDGTALLADSTVPSRLVEAVRKAETAGIAVYIVTGRSATEALDPWKRLTPERPLFSYNALVVSRPDRKLVEHARSLPRHALAPLLDTAIETADFMFVCLPLDRLSIVPKGYCRSDHEWIMSLFGDVTAVEGASALKLGLEDRREEVVKINLFVRERPGVEERTDALLAGVTRAYECKVRKFPLRVLPFFRDFPYLYYDLEPHNRGKAEALLHLEKTEGTGADSIVAVGDNHNDIEMLEAAGVAVAMGNAEEAVKRVADIVIGTNEEEAVAGLLEVMASWRSSRGASVAP